SSGSTRDSLPGATPSASAASGGELLLVRHGQTTWTAERRVVGRRPIALSDAGRAEIHALVPVLRALAPASIVTSPLVRARETAGILAEALACPLAEEPDLRELAFGEWEGRTYDELLADPRYQAFSRRPLEVAPPGGEPVADAQTRALAALGRTLAARPG